jgi:ABC-type transport system substrate-binding protein
MVDSVTAPDAATVVFRLNSPYGGFADVLSDRQVKIIPANLTDHVATQPIGTGPFKFVSYTPGDRLVLARHENYFEPGMPKLDGVELRIIPEMSVKVAALQAGDIDVVWDLPLEQVKPLSTTAGVRAESVPTASWDGAVMNNLIPPFNNPKVRQAFHLAVDKDDVVNLTLFGQGVPTISPIPPSHPFYAKDLVLPKTDPDAARKLLAEAGYPNGVTVPIVVPIGRPIRERLGVTLQQLAKPAGFTLQVQRVPYSTFPAEISGKAQFYIDGFFARPTIDTCTYPFLHSSESWNEKLNAERHPHQLSGGEKQRVGIARALASRPSFLVCDEAVSALDVSVQAAILNLLRDLRDELGVAYLFISHDIGVIAHIADRVAVMYRGSLVEEGAVDDVLRPPYHPYTELLLRSVERGHRIRCHIPLPVLGTIPPWLPIHRVEL